MKKKSFFLLLGFALAISSCSGTTDEPKPDTPEDPVVTPDEPSTITPATPIELTVAEAASRSACNSFGLNFVGTELSKHPESENVALSPFSAATTLAFYANAAGDELSQQIQTLLGSSDIDALNSYTAKMGAQLPSLDPCADLAIANAVWYNNAYTLNPGFANIAEEIYKSPCTAVDFADKAAAQGLIDAWVKKETRGMISDFKLPLEETTLSVVANALYFKGAWAQKFDKAKTSNDKFYGAAGETSASMMHATQTAACYSDDFLAMAALDFGNGTFRMHFVLPAQGITPVELLTDGLITSDKLFNTSVEPLALTIPRFEIQPTDKIEISSTLCEMGLPAIMTGHDFKMFTETVEDVAALIYQKTAVKVNEEGAEAAAATTIVPEATLGQLRELTLDRPFLFFITEKSTQTILFAGRVAQL